MKRVAALDLGTNSFLCLVAEGDADGIKRIVRDEMRIVRLGQELNQRHEFHPEALKRADQALSDFRKVIDQLKVDKVLALATSAARDAKNKEDFFAIGKKYDIPLKIISGQDEARISYRGATATVNKTGLKKSQALVVDIGGGSTELILGQNEKVLFSQSLDIGGVRLTEEIVESQPVTDKVHKQLLQRVENDLEPALKKIKEHNVEKIIAVAGTPTALAAAALGEFNPTKIDGFVFKAEELEEWVLRLKATSVEEKISKFKIESGRADIIYVGAIILWSIVKNLGIPSIEVSVKGVRYGLALELLEN